MIGFSALPAPMTPELSNVLLAIDAVALVVFLLVTGVLKIASGSNRLARLFGLPALRERFKLWFTAHKGH